MAPVFTAFDHSTYQKVISQHITDVLVMPQPILTMFQQGAFVVSLSGKEWHSVGIDEAHEMLINRECKSALVKPSPDTINRIANYLPYRSRAIKNIKCQLFPETTENPFKTSTPFSENNLDFKYEQNVRTQTQAILASTLQDKVDSNRGLTNYFTKKYAKEEQAHDLLNFR